jgi:translation initiation factor IF-2
VPGREGFGSGASVIAMLTFFDNAGHITSLKNVKKDVQEMRKGSECGMGFEVGWEGFEPGDQVQCYEEIKEKRRF